MKSFFGCKATMTSSMCVSPSSSAKIRRQVTRSSVDAIPLTVFSFNLSLIAESSAVFIAVEKLDVVKSDSSPFVDWGE